METKKQTVTTKDSAPDMSIVRKLANHINNNGQMNLDHWAKDQSFDFYLGYLAATRAAISIVSSTHSLAIVNLDIMKLSAEATLVLCKVDEITGKAASGKKLQEEYETWLRIYHLTNSAEQWYGDCPDPMENELIQLFLKERYPTAPHGKNSEIHTFAEAKEAYSKSIQQADYQAEGLH